MEPDRLADGMVFGETSTCTCPSCGWESRCDTCPSCGWESGWDDEEEWSGLAREDGPNRMDLGGHRQALWAWLVDRAGAPPKAALCHQTEGELDALEARLLPLLMEQGPRPLLERPSISREKLDRIFRLSSRDLLPYQQQGFNDRIEDALLDAIEIPTHQTTQETLDVLLRWWTALSPSCYSASAAQLAQRRLEVLEMIAASCPDFVSRQLVREQMEKLRQHQSRMLE